MDMAMLPHSVPHSHTHWVTFLFSLWALRHQIFADATNDFLVHFSSSKCMRYHIQVYVYVLWLHDSHNHWWVLMLFIDSTLAQLLRIDTPPSLILCYTIIHLYNTTPTSSPTPITLSTLLPYPNTSNRTDWYHLPHSFSSFLHHPAYTITTIRQQHMLHPTWLPTIHQNTYHHPSQKLILHWYYYPRPSVPPTITSLTHHRTISTTFSPLLLLASPTYSTYINGSLPLPSIHIS
jgi:hypothetical protein